MMSTKHSLPFEMNFQDTLLSNDIDISNSFNKYFCSTFSSPLIRDKLPVSKQNKFDLISDKEITNAIKCTKQGSSLGPEGIPITIIKDNLEFFVTVFSELFNAFIQQSYVPHSWRTAHITPILKKNLNPININSYRPISVTNNICRIFEKILCNRLIDFLENENLLSPNQHGFRRGKSVLTNLVDSYNYVTYQLELKNSVDVIYLDFEKGF